MITEATWMGHTYHLASGLGHVRGCKVCETGMDEAHTGGAVTEWHEKCKSSGRISVPLSEAPEEM